MAQPGMILDYAGPRKRSQFRLASLSVLECEATPFGVTVRERLTGQGSAVAAIIVAGIMFAICGSAVYSEWPQTPVPMRVIALLVIASGLALMPVIIQQTWRETVLRAGDGTLRLTMGGPLARRTFAWTYDEVESFRVIVTQTQADAPVLGEIEILAARTPPIRLFTDHMESQLVRIYAALDREIPQVR